MKVWHLLLIRNLLHVYTFTSCKAHFTNTEIRVIFVKASEKVRLSHRPSLQMRKQTLRGNEPT